MRVEEQSIGVPLEERVAVAWRILYLIVAATVGVASLSLLEPRNPAMVTAIFHGILMLAMAGVALLLRRGHVDIAGWSLASAFYLGTLSATILNVGFLQGAGTSYIVSVLVAAATVGRRSALVFAGLSIAGVSGVSWAAAHDLLPAPVLAEHSTTNAWISVALPLAMCGYLLHVTLKQHQKALSEAAEREGERDQAQAELLQSQKLEVVGRLGAGLAHDFNNLLTVIVGSAELLREESDHDHEVVDSIIDAADRGALLTTRLLAFGRPRPLQPRAQSVSRVLEEFCPLLERITGDEVDVVLHPIPPGCIEMDAIALEQVLLNLVINAKQAINGTGRIDIEVVRDGAYLRLRIRDTGPGVPDANVERIFEPFYTSKNTGTGLGLATVRSLVEQVGGKVTLIPTTSGACFEVSFPLSDAVLEDAQTSRPPPLPTDLKVLLVDDDEAVLEATALGLRAMGWDVTLAQDGLGAISRLERSRFDLVITDNAMHGIDGLRLARQIRSKFPELPVLLVSGNPVDAAFPPDVHYLAKPYGHRELAAAVGALLAASQRSIKMVADGTVAG